MLNGCLDVLKRSLKVTLEIEVLRDEVVEPEIDRGVLLFGLSFESRVLFQACYVLQEHFLNYLGLTSVAVYISL